MDFLFHSNLPFFRYSTIPAFIIFLSETPRHCRMVTKPLVARYPLPAASHHALFRVSCDLSLTPPLFNRILTNTFLQKSQWQRVRI